MSVIRPTWGYRKGEAKIFDLAPGDRLPVGWSSAPPPGEHPNVPPHAALEPVAEPPKAEPAPTLEELEEFEARAKSKRR